MTLRFAILAAVTMTAGLALASGPAAAQDKPSVAFNVGAASDYVFRGYSQSDNKPYVFAGADATFGQFYAGTWVANVDYDDSTDAEFDFYVGATPTLGIVSMDFAVLYYGYTDQPKGADYDYFEFKAAGSVPVGPATVGAQVYYSPNYYSGISHSLYYELNASYAPNDRTTLSAAVGRQTTSQPGDFTTWNIGVGYALTDHLDLDLRYHDNDTKGYGSTYRARVAASLKATF